MNKPLVSIIIPVYKVEQYLKRCINSVRNQTYSNWEIILIDDGSPDQCPKICDQYAKNDTRIKVIHQKNAGVSSARNAGLSIATGEYITFLDSDDFWHNTYIEVLLHQALESNADIVQCTFLRGNKDIFPNISNLASNTIRIYNNQSIFTSHAANVLIWGKLYRRHLWDGITMPVGKIHEDDFTTWKIYYQAQKIVIIDLPLYYYTYNIHGIMSQAQKEPQIDIILEAYNERINFFISKKEKDLEIISRLQLCKSLLLITKHLSPKKQQLAKHIFFYNWKYIHKSKLIPIPFKILFFSFLVSPIITSKLASKLK